MLCFVFNVSWIHSNCNITAKWTSLVFQELSFLNMSLSALFVHLVTCLSKGCSPSRKKINVTFTQTSWLCIITEENENEQTTSTRWQQVVLWIQRFWCITSNLHCHMGTAVCARGGWMQTGDTMWYLRNTHSKMLSLSLAKRKIWETVIPAVVWIIQTGSLH